MLLNANMIMPLNNKMIFFSECECNDHGAANKFLILVIASEKIYKKQKNITISPCVQAMPNTIMYSFFKQYLFSLK
jgi:hypothetical protein